MTVYYPLMVNSNNLKVVIPVAGAGTRLRPHTYWTPKSLLPVAGKPILAHILDPLVRLNPQEVIFVIGHMGEKIKEYVLAHYKFRASFVNQIDLFGLGYAVYMGIRDIPDSPILIVLGDTIAETDFAGFIATSRNRLGLKEVADPRRFGVAVIKNGNIVALEEKPEKPQSNLAVIGLYYFHSSAILKKHLEILIREDKKTDGEIQLTDAMAGMLVSNEEFEPFLVDGWFDCGKKETLLQTNRLLMKNQNNSGHIHETKIIPPVAIAATANIANSVIGPHVTISEGAIINQSKIKDSIIFEHAVISSCELEQSLIGSHATINGIRGSFNIGSSPEAE